LVECKVKNRDVAEEQLPDSLLRGPSREKGC